ncbi:dihydroorotase [Sedimentibacter acidaminivorans]|uniref:Dihydroorotase n=1 Tax=Sedimentibacter acidaminivorans TaxID=913099 RepID=A0ABS4GF13_9FIRM|nr:dihydroorotase [Sedimentibacter acidaminivorans]MBP1926283.1 dihydroorotase [Sedimentibacter acidaminivorans]
MILIKNGRVIDPESKIDEVLDVLIDENKIVEIKKNIENSNVKTIIEADGKIVAPGLIDVHVHFRDPGFTYKEDIFSGSESAACGGFTTVVCMANTNPVVDNAHTLKYLIDRFNNTKINLLQTASITKGIKGKELVDMEYLKSEGAVGFTDDGIPILDSSIILKSMIKAKELNVPLSFHEEDPCFIENSGINEGIISKQLGLGGASHLAEDLMVSRDCVLAIETGAKINIQHVSSGTSVDLIRFAKSHGANITAEVSPHHFSLTEKDVLEYKTYGKMNPPLRTEKDRLKLIEGLKDGTIDIIATDHAPHSCNEKNVEFTKAPSGIIGLETSLSLGITNLVMKKYLSIMQLIEKMTLNPAKLYNLKAGRINIGSIADIVIFDPSEKWVVNKFHSKSYNSPFLGKELSGKVKYTICNGIIVYND